MVTPASAFSDLRFNMNAIAEKTKKSSASHLRETLAGIGISLVVSDTIFMTGFPFR